MITTSLLTRRSVRKKLGKQRDASWGSTTTIWVGPTGTYINPGVDRQSARSPSRFREVILYRHVYNSLVQPLNLTDPRHGPVASWLPRCARGDFPDSAFGLGSGHLYVLFSVPSSVVAGTMPEPNARAGHLARYTGIRSGLRSKKRANEGELHAPEAGRNAVRRRPSFMKRGDNGVVSEAYTTTAMVVGECSLFDSASVPGISRSLSLSVCRSVCALSVVCLSYDKRRRHSQPTSARPELSALREAQDTNAGLGEKRDRLDQLTAER